MGKLLAQFERRERAIAWWVAEIGRV
jgi:hypothetical protein